MNLRSREARFVRGLPSTRSGGPAKPEPASGQGPQSVSGREGGRKSLGRCRFRKAHVGDQAGVIRRRGSRCRERSRADQPYAVDSWTATVRSSGKDVVDSLEECATLKIRIEAAGESTPDRTYAWGS